MKDETINQTESVAGSVLLEQSFGELNDHSNTMFGHFTFKGLGHAVLGSFV